MLIQLLHTAARVYPSGDAKTVWRRSRFLALAWRHREILRRFADSLEAVGCGHLLQADIPILGIVEWPYLHRDWPLSRRLAAVREHHEAVAHLPAVLSQASRSPQVLLDLSTQSAGVRLLLDRAPWFVREGELVLNLFQHDLRVMSVAFTLGREGGQLVQYVGAIQGLHANERSLEIFKGLTKDFEGLRPRDLILDVLRMVSGHLGVQRLWAVSEACRHHRHAFFAGKAAALSSLDYDLVWEEQQGQRLDNGFYQLPVHKARKSLAEVASGKRAMYRRRYAMLDEWDQRLGMFIHHRSDLAGLAGDAQPAGESRPVAVAKPWQEPPITPATAASVRGPEPAPGLAAQPVERQPA
jgi:uncharacterized protein VirK/YbjX